MASRHTPPPPQSRSKRLSATATSSPSSSGSTATITPPPSSSKSKMPVYDGGRTPPSALRRESSSADSPVAAAPPGARPKENVTVTVRFRPLSAKETSQGEEIAWYADGQMIARNENSPSLAYAYDRVFGPTTTTRHVYDVAAQQVVSAAMEGINGTIFAYGVTSSGKTHTMLGDQRSPGIIPLAVKDVFSIIQETPSREFLLRVSYLEIYNEVVNDLLNPAGQNLRIREDSQGTFVEGIKEEVVLSPAHALSLIAAGEEHRHVGSNNFNILSSRSHTIFTLTIESSPCGSQNEQDAVSFSLLNLIDLAGSESSRAETTGVRRKEGSYINRSLLTLGTVIAKLTDGKAAHIPYRDSKLTRLLQSSLNGQGRVSLICTVTPSSSNSEETHNTLKFAHRTKHIEIQALQNKIIDEKSLIKKYQNEIRCLRKELEQFRSGDADLSPMKDSGIKRRLEDEDINSQSGLLLEEEAKAALLGRIQRLTKLILVSTKSTQSPKLAQRLGSKLRNSLVEEELAYLPHRRQDIILESENVDLLASLEEHSDSADLTNKEEKKNKKHGILNWLKLRKRDGNGTTLASPECNKPAGTKSDTAYLNQAERKNCAMEDTCTDVFEMVHSAEVSNENYLPESSPDCNGTILTIEADTGCKELNEIKLQVGSSTSQGDSVCSPVEDATSDLLEELHSGEDLNDTSSLPETPPAGMNSADRIDLLKEQLKMLSGEAGPTSGILRRAPVDKKTNSLKKDHIKMESKKMNGEIKVTRELVSPEKQASDSVTSTPNTVEKLILSPCYADVVQQLNEKSFELEVKVADNRIIQDQLQQKISEYEALQEAVSSLKEQLEEAFESGKSSQYHLHGGMFFQNADNMPSRNIQAELMLKDQALDIDELNHKVIVLTSEKSQLENENQKLAEECSYAKGLASAAGVELKALSEQVAKLMNQNDRLATELANLRNSSQRKVTTGNATRNGKRENQTTKRYDSAVIKRELDANYEKEQMLETALRESEKREAELQRIVEESKQKETYLESEMANMWVLIAKLKKSRGIDSEEVELGIDP